MASDSDMLGRLTQEQFAQLTASLLQQQQQQQQRQGGSSSDIGSNKRPRDNQRLKVLLNGPVWDALSRECKEHLHFIEDEYYAAGMRIPFEHLAVPTGMSKNPLSESVIKSRRYLPLGMDGRITPGMSGLKAVYGDAVAYSETVRGTRHEHCGAVEKLIKELEALDKAGKLEASVKQLLPGARASFDIVDNVMDASVYMSHVRYPPLSDPTALDEAD